MMLVRSDSNSYGGVPYLVATAIAVATIMVVEVKVIVVNMVVVANGTDPLVWGGDGCPSSISFFI